MTSAISMIHSHWPVISNHTHSHNFHALLHWLFESIKKQSYILFIESSKLNSLNADALTFSPFQLNHWYTTQVDPFWCRMVCSLSPVRKRIFMKPTCEIHSLNIHWIRNRLLITVCKWKFYKFGLAWTTVATGINCTCVGRVTIDTPWLNLTWMWMKRKKYEVNQPFNVFIDSLMLCVEWFVLNVCILCKVSNDEFKRSVSALLFLHFDYHYWW